MKTMHCLAFTLAFNILLYRSEAFVVPARKAVIGNHLSLISATSFDEKTISQLKAKKSSEQRYDASPSDTPIQQQVEAALAPAANFLDDVSGGWALTYADLTPHRYVLLLKFFFLNQIHFFSQISIAKKLFLAKVSLLRT
jgi:hypothetical protein